jgi:hypothetical protein
VAPLVSLVSLVRLVSAPSRLPPPIAARVVATIVASLVSIPATYALLRAYEVLLKTEPNPALVVWSAHIAVFWRVSISAYVAGMVAPFAWVAANRDLARLVRFLCASVLVVGALIGLQGLFMP